MPPRGELLHELGRVELGIRSPAAIAHLQEALELTAEPGQRARIAIDLTEILIAAGQYKASLAALSEALARSGDLDPELAVDLETFRAVIWAYDPHLVAEFEADRERLGRLAEGHSWGARALAVLLGCIAVVRAEDFTEARRLLEHGLRSGALFAEHNAGGWASAHVLMALISMDADDRALEVIEELSGYARRSGSLIGTVTAIGYRGWVAARRGDLVSAEADLRTGLDVSVENGMPLLFAGVALSLLDAMLERPCLERCRRAGGVGRLRARLPDHRVRGDVAGDARMPTPGPR